MSEKKVATRQERLIFENLIRQDMQRGIRRSNQFSQEEIQNNQNNFQSRTQQNNMIRNEPQFPIQNNPNMMNNIPMNNKHQQIKNRRFNIKRNIGKRDAIWEQKRKRKMSMMSNNNSNQGMNYGRQQQGEIQYNQRSGYNQGNNQQYGNTPNTNMNQNYNRTMPNPNNNNYQLQNYNNRPTPNNYQQNNYGYDNLRNRTPFNENSFNRNIQTPMNNLNTMSKRPPSRPFQEGDISFKNQRMNANQNYYQNPQNNYNYNNNYY